MKRSMLAWIFFMICFTLLSYYACESSFTPRFNKPLQRENQNKINEMHLEAGSLQRRARGVYGGGDLLRPRTGHRNGAGSLLLRPSSFLSTLSRHVAVGLIIFFFLIF
ncbi:hypothetical protein POPTR_018G104600v4 [Populus trichocarpa]|uniref:Uncharacterized protein n=1 Tax=Populus trichocarpa TaxID=3694 RepID=A0A2K1WYZ3_POPTR|nr:hypothetical protein POPTR_018G104600v4 [Populus trichocarpa]